MTLPGNKVDIQKKLRQPLWKYLLGGVITVISLGVMARLLFQNIGVLSNIQEQLQIWPILASLLVFTLGEVLASIAWGKMINDFTTPISMWKHVQIYVITHAARRIPGSLWHVVGRIVWYQRLRVSKRVTTFGSVLETVLIVWSGLIVSLLLLPFLNFEQTRFWLIGAGILLSGLLMHPSILKFVLKRLNKDKDIPELFYRNILTWLVFYIPLWLVGGVILFLILNTLQPTPISFLPISIGSWAIAGVSGMLILILPAGFGLSEATLSLILSSYFPSAIAVTAAILLRVFLTFFEFFIAFLVWVVRGRLPKSFVK